MAPRTPAWMWSDALSMLERAERLHRQFFEPGTAGQSAVWEPPVDILETQHEVLILTALPGVAPDDIAATIEGSELVISGTRLLPPELRTAVIHRLELPQGCFRRRIQLPPGRYGDVRRKVLNGTLIVSLHKA